MVGASSQARVWARMRMQMHSTNVSKATKLGDHSVGVQAVNDFHFAMINDTPRNHFYRTALERAVKKGDTVLEIGTGSGLLAMLAARTGPQHVYAVEANRNMSELAQQLIKSNGLDSEITVINALSTHVEIGRVCLSTCLRPVHLCASDLKCPR